MRCPMCGAISPPSVRFCERDGTRLDSQNLLARFDHVEQEPVPELGGVSDRGKRHGWNEDALSLAAESLSDPVHVLVVCDGVSSSRNAQRAAQVAAETARATLLEG